MQDIPFISLACVFIGSSGLVLAALFLFQRADKRIESRVQGLSASLAGRSHGRAAIQSSTAGLSQRAEEMLARLRLDQGPLRQRLLHAGYSQPSAVTAFVLSQYLCAAGGAMIAAWICVHLKFGTFDLLLFSLIAACAGFLLPTYWLRHRKMVRQRVLLRSLPDFLDLLVTCVEAGLSLEGAIQRIANEFGSAHPELASEIARVQREMELGTPTDRALQGLAERTDLEPLRSIAAACGQARRFGTKLAAALRVQADILRCSREESAEETAQKASVKILLPTLLLLFPATFIVLAGPAVIQIYERFQAASLSKK